MQKAVGHDKFSTRSRQQCYHPSRFSVRTESATENDLDRRSSVWCCPWLAQEFLARLTGYLLVNFDPENTRCGTPADFREAMEPKVASSEPSVVSDYPIGP